MTVLGSRAVRRTVVLLCSTLFAVCVAYVVQTFQWSEIAHLLTKVDVAYLVFVGGSLIVVYWLLRALRWHLLLKAVNVKVGFFDLYMCTAVSLSIAVFTPLQSGEAVKVALIRKYGSMPSIPGYATFLVERILDLAVVLVMACWGLIAVLDVFPNVHYKYALLLGLLLTGFTGVLVLARLRLQGRIGHFIDVMRSSVGSLSTFALSLLVTVLSWSSMAFMWQAFLYGAGIPIDFWQTVGLMSLTTLVIIVSLIPGGLGVSDVGVFAILSQFGFDAVVAQAGTIAIRLSTVVMLVLGVGHLALWKLAANTVRSRGSSD
jgi:glycosyltransferase 2 family protein